MTIKRLTLSKIILSITLLFSTGLQWVLLRWTISPETTALISGAFAALAFIFMWRDLFKIKTDLRKEFLSYVWAVLIGTLSLLRIHLFRPPLITSYDLFFVLAAVYPLYRPSQIKELLIFSICLLTPLAIVEMYGIFLPFHITILLVGAGILLGMIIPLLKAYIFGYGAESNKIGGTNIGLASEPRWVGLLLMVFILSLFGILSFLKLTYPAGVPKNKRVMFDIGHGTTESPLIDYNKQLDNSAEFGHAKLLELLSTYGFDCGYIRRISENELSGTSILVIIMSSQPYTFDEIKAIKRFVKNGGGLLVIGDHTDINNTLACLNPVITQFGVRLRFDTLWLQANDRRNLYYRPHAATFDLEEINLSIGASLDVVSPARPLVLSRYGAFSDLGDPNNENQAYLGNSKFDPKERNYDLCLIAESLFGKGKVIVMGDSAYFQNASVYRNRAFAYKLFNWLNLSNSLIQKKLLLIETILLLLILIAFSALILFCKTQHHNALPRWFIPLLILTLCICLWIGSYYNLKHDKKPEKSVKSILIDMGHINEYSLYWLDRQKSDASLDGMIGQIIRAGYLPVLHTKGPITQTILEHHESLFILCPNVPYTGEEIDAVAHFVEQGGGLLLSEGPRKWASADPLWERFGLIKDRYPLSAVRPIISPFGLPIRLKYGDFRAQFIPHPVTRGVSFINMQNPCKISGGIPIGYILDIPVISFMTFGNGRVIAIGDDRFFANHMTEFQGKIIDRDKVRLLWNITEYLAKK